ncbi:MAG: alcohol dehydrogenase catalytic domain-containing protein [Candidatus Bathyarchaeia archaeon]
MRGKALVVTEPGRVELTETDVAEPRGMDVLVRTEACGICMGEAHTFTGKLKPRYPALMGHEGVGTIVSIGEQVVSLKPGDSVTTLGGPALAEYYRTVGGRAAKVPEGVEKPWLWVSEPVACAVNGARGANVEIGDDACVVGCGYMGLLLLQAPPRSHMGTLIAVDVDDEKLILAKRFGPR